jgi:hypothetical protein
MMFPPSCFNSVDIISSKFDDRPCTKTLSCGTAFIAVIFLQGTITGVFPSQAAEFQCWKLAWYRELVTIHFLQMLKKPLTDRKRLSFNFHDAIRAVVMVMKNRLPDSLQVSTHYYNILI